MLDQHLVHFVFREFGIERGADDGDEFGEGRLEVPVLFVGFVDVIAQGLRKVGNAALEFLHGALELALVGFVVGEEAIEESGDFDRFGQCEFAGLGAVLVENGGLRILKNGVAGGVAGPELFLNFGGEIVGGVFGLPPSAGETEFVANGAVRDDALAAGVSGEFRDEGPPAFFGGLVEKVLERAFQAEFMDDLVILEVLKVFEVGPDDRIGGRQFEHRMYESYRNWAFGLGVTAGDSVRWRFGLQGIVLQMREGIAGATRFIWHQILPEFFCSGGKNRRKCFKQAGSTFGAL